MTGITLGLPSNYAQTWGWTYNNASQVIGKTSANSLYDPRPPANDNEAHTYDGLNRDAAVTAVSGFDLNQNLITDPAGARNFIYDAENKLVAASGVGTSAPINLSYDPLGRLYQQTNSATGTVTTFLYSGDKLAAEYVGGAVTARYLHAAGEDLPLIQFTGASTAAVSAQYLYTDRQGSVIALATPSGTVSATFTYGPYGEPASWGGTRFAYTGQIELPEARLYHYKARVYDPVQGRFLQTDPIGYKDNLNLYGYVHDDPVNGLDPTGTQDGEGTAEDLGAIWGATKRAWSWLTKPVATGYTNGCTDMSCAQAMAYQKTYPYHLSMLEIAGLAADGAGLAAGAAKASSLAGLIGSAEVRFSQVTAGGGGKFDAIVQSMKANGWQGPAIDVVKTADGLTTIDNTRVLAARAAGLDQIPATVHAAGDALPESMAGRFGNSKTWGDALIYRTSRQSPPLPLTGTTNPPRVPQ